MADISQIKIGTNYYDIKDSVAREALNLLNRPIKYIGMSKGIGADSSNLTPILDKTHIDTSALGKLLPTYENSLIKDNSDNKRLTTGDVVTYRPQEGQENPREYIFILDANTPGQGTFFELTSNLGALAYVDTGKATFTPGGINQSSSVTLTGGKTIKYPVGKIERQKLVTTNIPKIDTAIVNTLTETLDLSNIFGSSNDVYFATGSIDDEDDRGGTIVYNIFEFNDDNEKENLDNIIALPYDFSLLKKVEVAIALPTSGTAAPLKFTGNPAIITVRPI